MTLEGSADANSDTPGASGPGSLQSSRCRPVRTSSRTTNSRSAGLIIGDWVASEELGDAARHWLRTLHVQQVGDALNLAVLDLREPHMEQIVALGEQPLGLRTQY